MAPAAPDLVAMSIAEGARAETAAFQAILASSALPVAMVQGLWAVVAGLVALRISYLSLGARIYPLQLAGAQKAVSVYRPSTGRVVES